MSGRAKYLVLGIAAILAIGAVLSIAFISYEDTVVIRIVPLDSLDGAAGGASMDAGALEDDSYRILPSEDVENAASLAPPDGYELVIEERSIPWEGGVIAFVLISSVMAVIIFARLREDDVLDGLRGDIFEYISENPGEHLAEITRQFGISSSSARHHLDVLEWSDKIVSHKSGKQKHFYPNRNGYRQYTSGFEYKEIMAILKNETCRDMVKVLIKNNRANQKTIADSLQIHPSTVNWHAKRLRAAQIIFKSRDGKDIHYSLNPELDLMKVISLIEGAGS